MMGSGIRIGKVFSEGTKVGSLDDSSELLDGRISTNNSTSVSLGARVHLSRGYMVIKL